VAGDDRQEVVDQLSTVRSLQSITVPMRPLDDVLGEAAVSGPVLIKIDVEGAEVPVLRSGKRFIVAARPTILFEGNDESSKRQMVPFLDEIGYVAFALPYTPGAGNIPLTGPETISHAGTNFAAIPRD
jgi:hypothetical protein